MAGFEKKSLLLNQHLPCDNHHINYNVLDYFNKTLANESTLLVGQNCTSQYNNRKSCSESKTNLFFLC